MILHRKELDQEQKEVVKYYAEYEETLSDAKLMWISPLIFYLVVFTL